MYRIHFDHRIGCFTIQVLVYGFFWRYVAIAGDGEPVADRATFKTVDDALDYVKSIGLDYLYEDKSANKFRKYMKEDSVKGAKSCDSIRDADSYER